MNRALVITAVKEVYAKFPFIEFEELIGRGIVIYLEAAKRFDEKRGVPFEAFILGQLRMRLRASITNRIQEYPHIDEDAWQYLEGNLSDPAKEYEFMSIVRGLSFESKEIVQLIFNCPWDIISGTAWKPKKMIGNLRRTLLAQGWTKWKMDKHFKEIKEALRP